MAEIKKHSDIERCKTIIGAMLDYIEASIERGAMVSPESQDWVWGGKRSLIDAVEILCLLLVKLHAIESPQEDHAQDGEVLNAEDMELLRYYLARQKTGGHEA